MPAATCRRTSRPLFRSASWSAAASLVLLATLGLGSPAAAEPVRFDNPPGAGHFNWIPATSGTNVVLNVTLAPAAQGVLISQPGSIRQSWSFGSTEVIVGATTASNNRIETAPAPSNARYLSPASLGDSIPRGLPTSFNISGAIHVNSPAPGDPVYPFAEGVEVYLGVRFPLVDGDHYGWIGVTRTGDFVDAFAWGYETTPGTPIQVGHPLPTADGACCNGTACSVGSQAACTGAYKGDNTSCQSPGNPTTCCRANINGEGGLSVQDIFDFLAAYFGNELIADFNQVGGLSVQDIFDFLAAYFTGCA